MRSPAAVGCGVHAGRLRSLLELARTAESRAQVGPAPDLDAQHALAAEAGGASERRPARRPRVEPARDLVARVRRGVGAVEPHRQALAVEARAERLGERADDRAHVGRRAPVVVVPPDPVAGLELVRGGAVLGQDAVDVVEPVDGAAVLAAAARRRRSPARSRRRSASRRRSRAAGSASPSRRAGIGSALPVPSSRVAEVARDEQVRAAVLALPRAQAAAAGGGRGDEHEEGEERRAASADGDPAREGADEAGLGGAERGAARRRGRDGRDAVGAGRRASRRRA